MPNGTRINEPDNTGIAAKIPNWVWLKPSFSLMGMPNTANTIQIMKQTVKDRVLAAKMLFALKR